MPKDRFAEHRSDKRYVGDCPICGRPMLKGKSIDKHHFLPKAEGGKPEHMQWVHRMCHKQIHALFTVKELSKDPALQSPERLRDLPEMEGFLKWIQKQPPELVSRTRTSRRLRR